MAAQAAIEDRLLILTLKAPESGTSEKTSSPPCGVLTEEEEVDMSTRMARLKHRRPDRAGGGETSSNGSFSLSLTVWAEVVEFVKILLTGWRRR
jgi:hypothetical protein